MNIAFFARRPLLTVFALLLATGAKAQIKPLPDSQVRPIIEQFNADRLTLERFYNMDYAPTRLARMLDFMRTAETRLAPLNFESLSQKERVDYLLLRNFLTKENRRLAFQRDRLEETRTIVPFTEAVSGLEEKRWRFLPVNPEQAADTLDKLSKEIKEIRAKVAAAVAKPESNPLKVSPVLANRAAGLLGELKQTLSLWFRNYDGYNPSFGWWCRRPYEVVDKQLEDYARYLRETVAGIKPGDDSVMLGDPIGREALLDDLKAEMITYSPEELVEIANKEFAWCEEQMKKVARDLGKGEDWKAALEDAKNHHVPPGEQELLVAESARTAIAFLDKHDLVTIDPLCRETWRFQMNSAEGQKSSPYAPYGGQKIIISYPTDRMEHESKQMSMRANNIASTRLVTPHELIPGHHLQTFVAERSNPYRRLFSTPFLVEGWALYWEMRFWDMDFPQTKEDRVGMLFWRMHRCARIIVSLNFHLGKMSPKEMIAFLTDRVGHERDAATAEVRRYIGGDYSPLYQVAYMIGGKQLYALQKELVGTGKMTERAFHDAVLRENSIPVDMIRASLAGTPLTKDYVTNWHFADAAMSRP